MTSTVLWLFLTLTASHVNATHTPSRQECEWLRADFIDAACDRFGDAKRQRCYRRIERKYACRPVHIPITNATPCFEDGSGTCVTVRVES